ncbi:MAG: YafY family protein [Candidatus Omnitrophica bacterium]|nr:YafY family protein [Candidatus Omnitrophota bacterium]
MKINRLLEITLILLNKKSVTAQELADRFNVSTRTIYRDVDELSGAGVPVFTNKGSGGGISLLEDFAISKAMLSEHERDSVLLALKTLQATRYPEIDAILEKIGAVFKKAAAADWVHIDFTPWGSGPNEENKFLNIKKAILETKIVAFDYINADGILSRREMEPMQLDFKGQAWYVWGYCKTRRDFRTFRISRIRNLSVTEENFKRRTPQSVKEEEPAATALKIVTLKLRFQPENLYRVYDDYGQDRIIRNNDGTYDVTVTVPEDDWVYGYIMSFGNYVEVLEPPHIRQIIRQKMEQTLKYYT